ncbi:MAG: trehalose-phosphatase [Acidimicrobiales bacterium]
MSDRDLRSNLQRLARTPTLLVACDYDGTLAPIVDNPDLAQPRLESVAALRSLADFPDTHVAVVSGRSLRDLAALSRLPSEIHLVGSHGSEFDAGFIRGLDEEQIELRRQITKELEDIAESAGPDFRIEKKPASVAFHYRNADPDDAEKAVKAILEGAAKLSGVQVKTGKMVIELAVVPTNKGTAIDTLRRQVAADAVLFVGDDVTDEDAFASLSGPDLGIKVGEGDTRAHLRIPNTEATAQMLALLCELRRSWMEGAEAPSIEEHSLLSDQRTVALVTPDARVTWMCHPRADSPAVFAELVGGPHAGYFSVRPVGDAPPLSQRYLAETLILETRWADLVVTDYLDTSFGRSSTPAGRTDMIRVLEGRARAQIEFAPRLDFGRAPTLLECIDDKVVVRGVRQAVELSAPGVDWTIASDGQNEKAIGEIQLDGSPLVLELSFDRTNGPSRAEPDRQNDTARYWREWADSLELPQVAADAVLRSALTLKALCHGPTGAILAAATTSLPEVPGGIRNWDYRYCWPRDASLSATALVELGSHEEALSLLNWVLDRVSNLPGPEQLRPLYPLTGDEYLPEAVLPTLHGYLGSRPVRIGNAADQQVQLDVFGPVADLAHRLAARGVPVSDDLWLLVQDLVMAVARRWHEPDHGIWEERRPQRHHVHSKVMCWMAVDRALKIAELTGREAPLAWRPLRHQIAGDVVSHGWNADVGAYTIAYGDDELDAAVLWIGLSGLLPTTDSRFVATVKAVERDLRTGPIVYRYRLDDGLPGDEGGFLLCTAWLIEAYVMMGQHQDARALFERYLDLAGSTGLLSEQYEPSTNLMLGNHPQAYSHLGLINAALALHRAG